MLKRACALKHQIRNFSNHEITIKFKEYLRKNDLKSALKLANQVKSDEKTLKTKHIELLIGVLANQKKRKHLFTPVILNLFESALNDESRRHKFSGSTLDKLSEAFCNQPDVLTGAAGLALLASKFAWNLKLPTEINRYLMDRQFEAAYRLYLRSRGPSRIVRTPVHQLVTQLCENGFYKECQVIFQDSIDQNLVLPFQLWMVFLEAAIREEDHEIIAFIWQHTGSRLGLYPTDIINKLLFISSESTDVHLLEMLSHEQLDRLGALPCETAGCIINCLVAGPNGGPTSSSTEDIFTKVQNLQPDVKLQHIPASAPYLSVAPCKNTLLMNYIIRAARTHKSPTLAFHQYRRFRDQGAVPDGDTLEQLIFAAYRLGNSKKLGATIFDECMSFGDVRPTRKTFETLLRISLTGKSYECVFHWLKLMRRHKIALRTNMHRSLLRKFDRIRDSRYNKLLKDVSLLEGYKFPTDEQLESSSSRKHVAYSAKRDYENCSDFINGWNTDYVLS